jgi:hypothetical protein
MRWLRAFIQRLLAAHRERRRRLLRDHGYD